MPKSAVRAFAHFLCLGPLLWLAARGFLIDSLGANPIEAVIRFLGDWALRFLFIALAVTPLRKITDWSALARYRRMLGLWAFAYASLHMTAYVVLDQFFDWAAIGGEIIKHRFITAGMAAFILLVPLAATSTAAMVRRLGGRRWRRLHQVVYLVAPLAAMHYIWMVKADIRQPLVYATILSFLLGFRAVLVLRKHAIA